MSDELDELLKAFGDSWSINVGCASHAAFSEVRFIRIPKLILESLQEGLIEFADTGESIVDEKIHHREMRLTDKGRFSIGLKPWAGTTPIVVEAKAQVATKEERTLF